LPKDVMISLNTLIMMKKCVIPKIFLSSLL
jgi:hypothetical protein